VWEAERKEPPSAGWLKALDQARPTTAAKLLRRDVAHDEGFDMCTGIRFSDGNGHVYLARNLDWTSGYGERVVLTPNRYATRSPSGAVTGIRHAVIGMGIVEDDTPLYFDCGNDAGLAVAGLNFPGYAQYAPAPVEGATNVAAYEFPLFGPPGCRGACERSSATTGAGSVRAPPRASVSSGCGSARRLLAATSVSGLRPAVGRWLSRLAPVGLINVVALPLPACGRPSLTFGPGGRSHGVARDTPTIHPTGPAMFVNTVSAEATGMHVQRAGHAGGAVAPNGVS